MSAPEASSFTPHYSGWVPTITARMSFRRLTVWRYTLRHREIAIDRRDGAPGAERLILARHLRITGDDFWKILLRAVLHWIPGKFALHLPPSSATHIYPPDDAFEHMLIARGRSDGDVIDYIDGCVFVIRDHRYRLQWVDEFNAAIDKIEDLSDDGQIASAAPVDDLEKLIPALVKQAGEFVHEPLLIVPFRLHRTGRCDLAMPTIPSLASSAPTEWPQDSQKQAAIAYRFIRDLFHAHYHHHPSEDRITDIHAHSDADPHRWARATERRLFNGVLDARRQGKLANALGQLSYLRSFRSAFAKASTHTVIPDRELDHLETSLRAKHDQATAEASARQIMVTALFILPVTLVSLLTNIHRAASDNRGDLGESLNALHFWLSSNTAVVWAAIFLSIPIYARLASGMRFTNLHLFKEFVRAFGTQAYARGAAAFAALNFVFGLALAAAAIWAIWSTAT